MGDPNIFTAIISCINSIIDAAIGFLENDCAFISGTWMYDEDGTLSCDLELNGETEHIFDFISESGEITIEQEGCNIKWLAGGLVVREGFIEENKITLNQGVAAIPLGGNVELSINEFNADGNACLFHIYLEGKGKFKGTVEENQEILNFECETQSAVILIDAN